MMSVASSFLARCDAVADYIPIVSTATNLIDLFQKALIIPFMDKERLNYRHYFKHLYLKNWSRSIVLMIPVVGNILIALLDFRKRSSHQREAILAAVRVDGRELEKASESLKNDPEIVLEAFQQNMFAIESMGELLRYDCKFMLQLIRNHYWAVNEAADDLRKSPKFMLACCKINPEALLFANASLKNNADFMISAIKINWQSAQFFGETLMYNREFWKKAIGANPHVMKAAPGWVTQEEELVTLAVSLDGKMLEFVSQEYQDDEYIVCVATIQNPAALSHASEQQKRNPAILSLVS